MRQAKQTADSVEERRGISAKERYERRLAIEQLLIAGVASGRIAALMEERFGMTEGMVRGLIERVRERWHEEEKENRGTYKATAMRRLYGHIAEAKKAGNWASVAQLERLLAEMQGTREPVEVALNIGATLSEAAAGVLASLSPEKIAKLVAEQKRLRELAAAKPVVETTGTTTEEAKP